MWRRALWAVLTPLVLATLVVLPSGQRAVGLRAKVTELRVGFFPTVLHAPVIVGLGEGVFQEALGDVRVVPRLFHAGPALIEALFAGEIDLAYVGPNPAINAWVRSNGRAIRIVAGSTRGGEGLVLRSGWEPSHPDDYAGRRFGTPQIGNTQDISLRRYLSDHGIPQHYIQIVSPGNAEIFSMFDRGVLDGAWVAEPWLSRLATEARGDIHFDSDVYTAYIAVRPELLESSSDLIEAWLGAHIAISQRLNAYTSESAVIIAAEMSELWQWEVAPHTVELALQRVQFVWDASEAALEERANDAFLLRFFGSEPPHIKGIVDAGPLENLLRSLGREYFEGEWDES